MRIGTGTDIHALVEGVPLRLGGVTIPFEKGLKGHSDGDALLHAISSAILGALNLGDLGSHFPSSDPSLEGIDSREILKRTAFMMRERGFEICNVDSTVLAQRPRLAPHREKMCDSISSCLGVSGDQISVKAATSDRLGFTGRGEGIMAHAVVLLRPVS